jgi:RNA polymerase sigma-70 factor (ECF subfamily)
MPWRRGQDDDDMKSETNKTNHRFKTLAYPHMSLVYNVALKYTGNAFDAHDLVQETYLMAFKYFYQLKDPDRIKPWLLKILRNNFLKTCRTNTEKHQQQQTDYIEHLKSCVEKIDTDDRLALAADTRLVNQAIDALPVKFKDVLTLYYMQDMPYKEIAAALDIPMGTVMSRLNRARERLKTILLDQLQDRRHLFQIHLETEST